jgi:ABC-type transport system substrate-binding protein
MISNFNLTAKLSDPLDFLEVWSYSAAEYDINWSGSSFNQYISAAKFGWHPNIDSDKNLYRAEYRLMDDMVIIPLYQQSDAILVKEFVKNWSKNQMGYFWFGDANIEYMYKDIEQNHFAYSAVKDLYEKNILDFHDGFYFNPDKPVTKSDVHAWLERSLRKANIDKLMKESSFGETITREEAAYYIVKVFKIKAYKGSYSLPKDLNNAKEDYQDEIAILYKRGITKGLFGDYFQPNKEITNAEFATLLHTVLNK